MSLFDHAQPKVDEPSASEPALLADVDVVIFGSRVSTLDPELDKTVGCQKCHNQEVEEYSLRFTEELVFPPVRILVQSHCMTTSELCMPQFEQSMWKAWPLR